MTEWIRDVLGDEFQQLTLDLGTDEQGPVVATLVRALPAEPDLWNRIRGRWPLLDGVDVLYVHGWSDYFFQKRLARFWTSRGARFFALDLRKYGRSPPRRTDARLRRRPRHLRRGHRGGAGSDGTGAGRNRVVPASGCCSDTRPAGSS